MKICYYWTDVRGENMNYNELYHKVNNDLLKINGNFSMKTVLFTTYLNSLDDFTKKQIKKLALQVLDDSLNNGMISMVRDGVYVSSLSKSKMVR